MRELGLAMDTPRGLNNVNRAFHFYRSAQEEDENVGDQVPEGSQIGKRATRPRSVGVLKLGRGLLSLESQESLTILDIVVHNVIHPYRGRMAKPVE